VEMACASVDVTVTEGLLARLSSRFVVAATARALPLVVAKDLALRYLILNIARRMSILVRNAKKREAQD